MQSCRRIGSIMRVSKLQTTHPAITVSARPRITGNSSLAIGGTKTPVKYMHTSRAMFSEEKEQNGETTEKTEEQTETSQQEEELDPKDKRIRELEEEVENLNSQLRYSLAERENIRRIAKLDVESARDFGISKFAKSMLEVADNVERCLANVSKADLENNKPLSTLFEGLELTERELHKSLASHGVTKFDPMDQKFDPNIMNALIHVPMPGKEPGTVGLVVKAGYKLNDRILRPADVGVAKAPDS